MQGALVGMWFPHDISIYHEMTSGDTSTHVTKALWMEGVCRGQTASKPSIHRAPSYGLWNYSSNQKKVSLDILWGIPLGFKEPFGNLQNPTQMLSYKWLNLISSQGWSSKGAWSWWLVPILLEGRGRSLNSPVGIISSANPSIETLSLKNFIQDSWVDGGGDFIQHEVFQALPEGKRSKELGQHRKLIRSIRSQSTTKIFLAPDHTRGIHNASMTRHLYMSFWSSCVRWDVMRVPHFYYTDYPK